MKHRRRLLWVLLGVIIVGVGVYPVETSVVPEWSVRVVDERGTPVRGAVVRQSWQHYSLERNGHEEDLATDSDGYVTFQPRKIRAGLFGRIMVPVLNAFSLREHASFGPSASVTVWGEHGSYSSAQYEPNKSLPDKLTFPSMP